MSLIIITTMKAPTNKYIDMIFHSTPIVLTQLFPIHIEALPIDHKTIMISNEISIYIERNVKPKHDNKQVTLFVATKVIFETNYVNIHIIHHVSHFLSNIIHCI